MPRKKKSDKLKRQLTITKDIENFKEISLENEKLHSSYGSAKHKHIEKIRALDISQTNSYKFAQLKKNFSDKELKNIGITFSFDAAYRGIKSSLLRQMLEEKCVSERSIDRRSLYQKSAQSIRDEIPLQSIDTIITRLKSIRDVVELTGVVKSQLKDRGLCVALLNNELLPFLFREVFEKGWCYIWTLSYRLPIVDKRDIVKCCV